MQGNNPKYAEALVYCLLIMILVALSGCQTASNVSPTMTVPPPTVTPEPSPTPVPPTPTAAPIPVNINIFQLPGEIIIFEEYIVKVGAQVSDADDKHVSGAQVEASIASPDGTLHEGSLEESSEGVYRGEVCTLGSAARPGTYTVTLTVGGSHQGQQVGTFTVLGPKVIEMYDFQVEVPPFFDYVIQDKEARPALEGDVIVDFHQSHLDGFISGIVLVYSKTGQVQLEVEPVTQLLAHITHVAGGMEVTVKDSKPTELDDKPAFYLSGRWTGDNLEKPFEAVSVQCGEHFFMVVGLAYDRPLNFFWPGILESFHCLE